MAQRFYEQDGNLALLKGKTVAIIGYGSQGHAHALNLRDSGVNVIVGLYPGSKSWAKAETAGLKVMTTAEAAKAADVMMVLVSDHLQADLYEKDIKPGLTAGKTLMFAHGFAIHFKTIVPPADVDVSMIAPKAPGHRVRELYTEGVGVPGLVAVHQNPSGKAREQAMRVESVDRDFGDRAHGVDAMLEAMAQTGTRPEFECFDVGIVRSVGMYRKNGMTDHLEYNFVMGVASGMPGFVARMSLSRFSASRGLPAESSSSAY